MIPVNRWVSPFGNPRIKVCLKTNRGLSHSTTSFIASDCQGIHHMRLIAWPYIPKQPELFFHYWKPKSNHRDIGKFLKRTKFKYKNWFLKIEFFAICKYTRIIYGNSQPLIEVIHHLMRVFRNKNRLNYSCSRLNNYQIIKEQNLTIK